MHTRELQTFISVAQTQSISRTAEALHLSQPAVSKRIQALESDLHTQLFDRVGKRLVLTQGGELLLASAQQLLAQWADTQHRLQHLTQAISGPLRLATSHHIGLHRLAPVLAEFRQRHPDVQLDIVFEDSEITHEMVLRGEIELAVATLPTEENPALATEAIWQDPLTFVSTRANGHSMSLADLATQPCVLPGLATYTGRIVMTRFEQAGVALQPTMSTNYLETISMLVRVGFGWSVLPRSMCGDLAELSVVCDPMLRRLGCITHPQRTQSNAGAAFVSVLREFGDSP